MQLYNSDKNARFLIHWNNIRTYTPVRPMSNFSFSICHIFQFRFWPHQRNCHDCHSASAQHISLISDHSRRRYDVLPLFTMAAAVAQFYLRFRTGWRHFLQKINVYQHTEYRQDNSIHGRDITISVLQNQTSAILKFSFRFWLWPHRRNPYGILHKIAKLHIGPPNAEIWRHSFSRWRPRMTSQISQ